jgi:hypothetical protein
MSIYDGTYGDDEANHPETKENRSSSYFVDTYMLARTCLSPCSPFVYCGQEIAEGRSLDQASEGVDPSAKRSHLPYTWTWDGSTSI